MEMNIWNLGALQKTQDKLAYSFGQKKGQKHDIYFKCLIESLCISVKE